MEMFCPDHPVCCTCTHWSGTRTADENRFVHNAGEAGGRCGLSGTVSLAGQSCAIQRWSMWDVRNALAKGLPTQCWEDSACGFEDGGQNAVKFGTCPVFYSATAPQPVFQRQLCHLRHTQLFAEAQKPLPIGGAPKPS